MYFDHLHSDYIHVIINELLLLMGYTMHYILEMELSSLPTSYKLMITYM